MTHQPYRLAPLFLITLGLLGMALGIARRESAVIFTKVIAICLECIGIG